MGDLNKYKSVISTSMCPTGDLNKYKSVISTSMCPTGDLNKYESTISTSRCISDKTRPGYPPRIPRVVPPSEVPTVQPLGNVQWNLNFKKESKHLH